MSGKSEKQGESLAATDRPVLGFEELMAQLGLVVKALEGGELSLDDSVKQFEKGMQLARLCQSQLTASQQRVDILSRVLGSPDGSAQNGLQGVCASSEVV